jgi:hypothetical protein
MERTPLPQAVAIATSPSFVSHESGPAINTIRTCNIEVDAAVFGFAQNSRTKPIRPMSLSALRFQPTRRGRKLL